MGTYIFTDGASKGNPGPGGWGAVIHNGVNVYELGGREKETTNNKMELTAALSALQSISNKEKPITLFTDSSYLINGITKWIFSWEKNNWKTKTKTDVLNVDLWKNLRNVLRDMKVSWRYVPGHSDVAGNERANDIAELFASGKKPDLFNGKLENYSISLLEKGAPLNRSGKVSTLTKDSTRKKKKSGVAYSYVSFLDGKIEIHATWEECKKRVHGKNALFKKTLSKAEEEAVIAEFKK